MKKPMIRMLVLFLSLFVMAELAEPVREAEARAGGSRSMGSRGSRSYAPRSPQQAPTYQQRQQAAPPPYQAPQPAPGGGFLRSMAGGIVGGMLGGMLFRSLGFGGGGMGGGGIGLFDILLIGGILYLIYRFVTRKRAEPQTSQQNSYNSSEGYQQPYQSYAPPQDDRESGLAHIRQMDPTFDEQRFADNVMDLFFKIQGAWMNRDLAPVSHLLTPQMKQIFQADVDRMLRERRMNRLENIAVRSVEIAEAWQESGQDFITASIYANLLDYTTDDTTGQLIEGSKTEPVKFEEYWTVTRPVGSNTWQLSAIDQK